MGDGGGGRRAFFFAVVGLGPGALRRREGEEMVIVSAIYSGRGVSSVPSPARRRLEDVVGSREIVVDATGGAVRLAGPVYMGRRMLGGIFCEDEVPSPRLYPGCI